MSVWKARTGPLEEPAGEWFVNRKEDLELFWEWGTGIPHPGRRSFALIGLRRTGKTAVLHKVFNRLFHEQERVLPVYITFARYLHREKPINSYEFIEEFVKGYSISYLAFHYKLPHLFGSPIEMFEVEQLVEEHSEQRLSDLIRRYRNALQGDLSGAYQLVNWAIDIPRGFARQYDMPTALMIDEFQVLTNVYNPDSGMFNDVTNGFQHASETRYAPMLVSGSSVSMMRGEAMAGMLSGRFQPWTMEPLSEEHTVDMVFRLGATRDMPITKELAVAIWELTQGYPYPIECLLNSVSPAAALLPDLDALDEVVYFELTDRRGALHDHYENEYGKYVRELNGDNTTRKILYWITNNPKAHIHSGRLAEALGLDLLTVRESLEKLYKIDVIERASSTTFWGPKEPLMREFLRYEHQMEVENLAAADASAELRQTLRKTLGEMSRRTGHFTEIIVGGAMNNYRGEEVDGATYFGLPETITLPRMETIIRREGVLKEGIPKEIDVIGEHKLYNGKDGNPSLGAWLVSVRYRKRKMSDSDVQDFIDQVEAVQAEKGYGEIVRWYFSKSGFTKKAKLLLEAEGIYHSDLEQFNALAALFGLLPLKM